MINCLLCKKKFKTRKGLSIHLTRTHNIHGYRSRFSLNTIQKFFPLLTKKRWAKAERLLNSKMKNAGNDEWMQGYLHALNGMIIALKSSYSNPEPYILNLKEFSQKKLLKIKSTFNNLSNSLDTQNIFDSAYFQAWVDFTNYTLDLQN
jgi:hypothetical protein